MTARVLPFGMPHAPVRPVQPTDAQITRDRWSRLGILSFGIQRHSRAYQKILAQQPVGLRTWLRLWWRGELHKAFED